MLHAVQSCPTPAGTWLEWSRWCRSILAIRYFSVLILTPANVCGTYVRTHTQYHPMTEYAHTARRLLETAASALALTEWRPYKKIDEARLV